MQIASHHRFFFITVVVLLYTATAFAGPPFQTDDPDPVPYRHYEAYAFELSDTTSTTGTSLSIPAVEFNWGAAPNLQLHIIAPLVTSFTPDGGPTNSGMGDLELGAKYRLVKETKYRPEIGIFPFIELPTGDASRGLGVGSTWYRLPLWLQKSWGPWTTYGGGGEVLIHQPGSRNYAFAGWLLQRQISKKLTLGAELFRHGAENVDPDGVRHATMADLGTIYEFRDGFELLAAAGHSIKGHPETYTYLALYWTWGKDTKDSALPHMLTDAMK
jgi:hypothetical protein